MYNLYFCRHFEVHWENEGDGINCSNIDLNDKICHDTKILLGRINFVNDQQRVFRTGNVYGESDVDSAAEGIV